MCLVYNLQNAVTSIHNSCLSQIKYKQAREERRKLLTPAHKYMIDILSDRLYLEPTAVEEFILDSSVSFDCIFTEYPIRAVIYYPCDCCLLYKFIFLFSCSIVGYV